MEILYENKSSEKEILDKSKNVKNTISFLYNNNSLLFKSDNFPAMSLLLERYAGKIDLIYTAPLSILVKTLRYLKA